LEVFKRSNVPDSNLVEVCHSDGKVVILSENCAIYTDFFFNDLRVEKNGTSPKYRLPPGK